VVYSDDDDVGGGGVPFVESLPRCHGKNRPGGGHGSRSPLPDLPDASESDEIAIFSENVPTDLAKDDAWEYLDPMLNRFLGFNRTAESIENELRGRAQGLSAMMRYLKDFVCRYEVDGGLLEGKIERLVKIIQTQCVAMIRSNHTHF